jgi:energy-coupling factor transporter ATP-binding protein EcfA2/quercetin dioxygenase-like cupin family protein
MVFQSYAIWPHMNVFANVAFPLQVLPRKRRPPRKELHARVERALGVVKLDHLASRPATDLSGGQQQRLALARALVMEPPLLLLDEPLSNLDAKLRDEMRFELKRLQRELGITGVYVTHDQVEALAMSNRVAVMRDGKIEQVGPPREVYERPRSRFVADFIGTSNFIDGVVRAKQDGVYTVETPDGELRVPSDADFAPGARVVVAGAGDRLEAETRIATIKIGRDELALVEFDLRPGFEGPRPHVHRRHVDAFFVVTGAPQFRVGGGTVEGESGMFVAAPPGAVHSFANPGPEPARLVNVHAPSCGFHDYLHVMDEAEEELDEATHARFDVYELDA